MHSLRTAAARAALAVVAAVTIAACGGSSDAPPAADFQVSFDESSAVVSTFDDLPSSNVSVMVTISPAPGPDDVVLVTQSGTDFDLPGMSILQVGAGAYEVDLPIDPSLPPGTHTGTLSLRICRDLSCAQPYRLSRSSLPYSVTVVHRGAGGGAGTVDYLYDVVSDSNWDDTTGREAFLAFTITPMPADLPTVRVVDGGGFFPAGTVGVYEFAGTFYADVPYPDARGAGTYSGTLTLAICADAACALPYALPLPTLPYHVEIFHVEAGLAPLTAALTLDGAPISIVHEGTNGLGERTYAVAMRVGQIIDIQASADPIRIVRAPGGTATATFVPADYPLLRYQASPLAGGASSGHLTLSIRVTDGRWLHVTLNVTP